MVSERFRFAVKISKHRAFELARYGGLSASHFSALVNNAARVKTGDEPVRRGVS